MKGSPIQERRQQSLVQSSPVQDRRQQGFLKTPPRKKGFQALPVEAPSLGEEAMDKMVNSAVDETRGNRTKEPGNRKRSGWVAGDSAMYLRSGTAGDGELVEIMKVHTEDIDVYYISYSLYTTHCTH
jgi:hypothetical protein